MDFIKFAKEIQEKIRNRAIITNQTRSRYVKYCRHGFEGSVIIFKILPN